MLTARSPRSLLTILVFTRNAFSLLLRVTKVVSFKVNLPTLFRDSQFDVDRFALRFHTIRHASSSSVSFISSLLPSAGCLKSFFSLFLPFHPLLLQTPSKLITDIHAYTLMLSPLQHPILGEECRGARPATFREVDQRSGA